MILSFLRIIKFSIQDIFRNIWLSIVTITILILALFSINMILVVQVVGETAIDAVKQKVDMSIYLSSSATEEEITALKTKIENISEVKEVSYISRTEAMDFFQEEYSDNPEVLDALSELGKNPLSPSLVIKPNSSEKSKDLIMKLNSIESDVIQSRDFADHEFMLEKIDTITEKVSQVGIFIASIFLFVTILVVYNSIRVAIYTHRREISIMKLVGASNPFVYMPFVLSGFIYSLVGVGAIVAIFYPFLTLLQPYIEVFFIDFDVNVLGYFNQNFLMIFGGQLLAIAFINMLASLIAVRKYARV